MKANPAINCAVHRINHTPTLTRPSGQQFTLNFIGARTSVRRNTRARSSLGRAPKRARKPTFLRDESRAPNLQGVSKRIAASGTFSHRMGEGGVRVRMPCMLRNPQYLIESLKI